MQLKTVTFEGDLEDADEGQLRSAIEDFEKAQEANAAEFEAAKERLEDTLGDDAEFDEVFGEVEDFAEAKESLIETITEFDSFEEAPMAERVLRDSDFSELRDYEAYFADLDADNTDEGGEGDGDGEFNDMGQRGPTNPDDGDADAEFAQEHLSGMPGFQRGGN